MNVSFGSRKRVGLKVLACFAAFMMVSSVFVTPAGTEPKAPVLSGGGYHSLAVRVDGTVWAWGSNAYGQLGDGTTTDSPAPVQVSGLASVTAVSAGSYHSLALRVDGTVWAWGRNLYGQLGDDSTTQRLTPVQTFFTPAIAVVTFYQIGVDTDFTGTVLTIDGTTNLSVNDLPKTFTWEIGSTHTYAYASPLATGLDKQYVLTSTISGGAPTTQSGTITALIWGGTYTGNYAAPIIGDISGPEGVPDGVVDIYDLNALGKNYGKGG